MSKMDHDDMAMVGLTAAMDRMRAEIEDTHGGTRQVVLSRLEAAILCNMAEVAYCLLIAGGWVQTEENIRKMYLGLSKRLLDMLREMPELKTEGRDGLEAVLVGASAILRGEKLRDFVLPYCNGVID